MVLIVALPAVAAAERVFLPGCHVSPCMSVPRRALVHPLALQRQCGVFSLLRELGTLSLIHILQSHAQALTYSLALLRHWRGTETDMLAMVDVDEYIVIENAGQNMQARRPPLSLYTVITSHCVHAVCASYHDGLNPDHPS